MQTIQLIKNNKILLINSAALIEGVQVDYETTRKIVEKGQCDCITDTDTNVVIGIEKAYEELERLCQLSLDISILSRYNYLIGYGDTFEYPGFIRGDCEVYVNEYYPEQVDEYTLVNIINTAENTFTDKILQGCSILANICKAQIFYNGNKRTAQIATNHYFAYNNTGCFITIPQEQISFFHNLLYLYYMGNVEHQDICNFLYKCCGQDKN